MSSNCMKLRLLPSAYSINYLYLHLFISCKARLCIDVETLPIVAVEMRNSPSVDLDVMHMAFFTNIAITSKT